MADITPQGMKETTMTAFLLLLLAQVIADFILQSDKLAAEKLWHSLEAVAFILAAKSVARYVELDKKMSAEYYLVGTLASLLVAALGGLALQTLAPLFQ